MKKMVKKKKKIDLKFAQDRHGTFSLTEIAGMIPNGEYNKFSLAKLLRECKEPFFYEKTTPYKKFEKQGYVIIKIKAVADGKKHVPVPRFTLKGVDFVLDLVNKEGENA